MLGRSYFALYMLKLFNIFMNFVDNLRCILQAYDLTAECMFTGILVLKFLLSILKFLGADNTE